jgi:hypothetical protein
VIPLTSLLAKTLGVALIGELQGGGVLTPLFKKKEKRHESP